MMSAATIVGNIRSAEGQKAGAIEFRIGEDWKDSWDGGLACRCPCGCGAEMYLPVRPAGTSRGDSPEWEFDGNREKPTLRPSVFNSGLPCQWHGWLRNGVWTSA